MATKADFNAEEWSKLVEAPVLAAMRVSGASGGGRIREAMAIAKVYAHARREQGDSALLDEIVASPPAIAEAVPGDDVSAVVSARLAEGLRIVDDKSPEDADAYRGFVVTVARAAAEAHEEGGFIGIGGRKISDEEAAALNEIQAVIDAT
jgi:hypothetical protein